MSEAVTLDRGSYEVPVFGAAEAAQMVRDGTVPPADELSYGFVISDDHETPDSDLIHQRHSLVIAKLLRLSGLVHEPQIVPESNTPIFTSTPEHTDGLVGTFYQLGTQLPEDPRLVVHVKLRSYGLSDEQHKLLQTMRGEGHGLSAHESILFQRSAINPSRPHLSSAVGATEPIVVWEHGVNWGETLVMPNGYDATKSSSPNDLLTHEFQCLRTREGLPVANTRRDRFMSRVQEASMSSQLAGVREPRNRFTATLRRIAGI